MAMITESAYAGWLLGGTLFIFDFGAMLFFINYLSLRQSVTPDHLLGRVTSTMIFLALSLAPFGSLIGGVLANWLGLRATIGVCGIAGVLLIVALVKFSPLVAMQKLPTPDAYPVPPPKTPGPEVAGD
jgi:MFS family permease